LTILINYTSLSDPTEKSKGTVFIIEQESTFHEGFIGVRIEENGKLYAGAFDLFGKLQGRGIYINKKGNVFLGLDFKDDTISEGKILQLNDIIYQGSLVNFKKHGLFAVEIKQNKYKFEGTFKDNKRISGKLTLQHQFIKEMQIEDYSKMTGEYKTQIKFVNREDHECIYEGKVAFNKLNDENASIKVMNKDTKDTEVFSYEGNISKNVKTGKGKYFWGSKKEYYEGNFEDNKIHTIGANFNDPKDYSNHGIIEHDGRKRNVIFDKGHLVRYAFMDTTTSI